MNNLCSYQISSNTIYVVIKSGLRTVVAFQYRNAQFELESDHVYNFFEFQTRTAFNFQNSNLRSDFEVSP